MRVGNVKYSFRTTPRMMVFISGIPEPWESNKAAIEIRDFAGFWPTLNF
jgi:hypothetical protein